METIVIANIDWDQRTLFACGLVCKLWRTLVVPRLYRHLAVSDPSDSGLINGAINLTSANFEKCMEHRPEWGESVVRLSLQGNLGGDPDAVLENALQVFTGYRELHLIGQDLLELLVLHGPDVLRMNHLVSLTISNAMVQDLGDFHFMLVEMKSLNILELNKLSARSLQLPVEPLRQHAPKGTVTASLVNGSTVIEKWLLPCCVDFCQIKLVNALDRARDRDEWRELLAIHASTTPTQLWVQVTLRVGRE